MTNSYNGLIYITRLKAYSKMEGKIVVNNEKYLLSSGTKALTNNKFFNFLDTIMNEPSMRKSIDEYFHDWDDVKTVFMFIKVYQAVEKEISSQIPEEDKRKIIIGMVNDIINNTDCRKQIVDNMLLFTQTPIVVKYKSITN